MKQGGYQGRSAVARSIILSGMTTTVVVEQHVDGSGILGRARQKAAQLREVGVDALAPLPLPRLAPPLQTLAPTMALSATLANVGVGRLTHRSEAALRLDPSIEPPLVLSALCKSGNAAHALEVLDNLEAAAGAGGGCAPNASSYNAVMGGLWNVDDRPRALETVSRMLEKGVDPDEVTYNVLISCLCRDGRVDEAVGLITYNTVLLGLCKAHWVEEAVEVLAEMVLEKACRANETTYVLLVEGVAYTGHRREAMELARELAKRGVLPEESLKRLCRTFPML